MRYDITPRYPQDTFNTVLLNSARTFFDYRNLGTLPTYSGGPQIAYHSCIPARTSFKVDVVLSYSYCFKVIMYAAAAVDVSIGMLWNMFSSLRT